jgi:hypothetical protein
MEIMKIFRFIFLFLFLVSVIFYLITFYRRFIVTRRLSGKFNTLPPVKRGLTLWRKITLGFFAFIGIATLAFGIQTGSLFSTQGLLPAWLIILFCGIYVADGITGKGGFSIGSGMVSFFYNDNGFVLMPAQPNKFFSSVYAEWPSVTGIKFSRNAKYKSYWDGIIEVENDGNYKITVNEKLKDLYKDLFIDKTGRVTVAE